MTIGSWTGKSHSRRGGFFLAFLALFLLGQWLYSAPTGAAGWLPEESHEEERQELREARFDALSRLYAEQPDTESEVDRSLGYAVFSVTFGVR